MVFVLVLKKNAIIQTILRITENGVSIGTKIKKMVLTHLGSGAISRIPGANTVDTKSATKLLLLSSKAYYRLACVKKSLLLPTLDITLI